MLDPVERKMLYAFLSALFREPDEQMVAAAGEVKEDTFETIFPGLSMPPAGLELPELREGYDRLFVGEHGEPPAPPYGSVYLEKPGSEGNSTRLVDSLYASAGLNTENSHQPSDYLPTELEFLYYLTEGEQQSLAENTGTSPFRWVSSQADFFHNFFAPWVGPFCDRIEGAPQSHPFYRWAAELLRRFVDLERNRLEGK